MHGIIRDAQGIKMSKSLGNSMDPLDLSSKYGTDAIRMSLIMGTGPGNDSKMNEDKIRAYKNYANKLWNIARFVMTSTEGITYDPDYENHSDKDKELIKERDEMIKTITSEMQEYKFYLAGDKIYQYTWARFADVIIEESKNIFESGNEIDTLSRKQFLFDTLSKIIKILHPFMPFVTEEIWSMIPTLNKKLLMVEKWPN